MYHYVRDFARTRFTRIKGRDIRDFEGQLDYITAQYCVCSLAQVAAAVRGEYKLPKNACVLTFDDGLKDHYTMVFPRLLERRLSGAFFPPAAPIMEHRVLDVHKIHFLLAAVSDHAELAEEVLRGLEEFRTEFAIAPQQELRRELGTSNRFDPPETAFIKRLLQWALPEAVRTALVHRAFAKYVSGDEGEFARELYAESDELREMASLGMEIGGHGYNHVWLGKEPRKAQSEEIARTVAFVASILGRNPTDWVMSYPYGSYNADTLELASMMGCGMGLTTAVGLADIRRPLELGRLDTNDLPTTAEAGRSDWTTCVDA